ncbi:nitroreductase family deazaflavin-dependent oxidoreductase [Candidatus Chloroploca asiatica]|uniref:Nitroreductase n=1 Tax=Candidatus Chloroploca asiatica TaxID=1506545 RepID=A0A2H3KK10_9CHLR|nr:nitroreductase family deazaflavin-dependent oxidoreductase [Candidatus Chloroploca asiatica]PDV98262.1 hypothetical protein A9Q02_16220 [Candidatus Chloroploca asiatica]
MSQTSEHLLRQMFKRLNPLMLWHWRVGMGAYLNFWPSGIGRFLILIHTGRKSGRLYRTPVNYAERDGDVYVTSGFGRSADWYHNLMAQPRTEVWLPDGRWLVEVEDVTESAGKTAIMRDVLQGSGFAAYLAGINPHRLSDADLDAGTASYRLLRLRRVAPLAGSGGPGDVIWLWPLLVLLAFLLGRGWPRR